MRIKIIITVLLLSAVIIAQTEYELIPGSKGNEITLQLSNKSENLSAEYLEIMIVRGSENLEFNKTEELITDLENGYEKEVSFIFDVNHNCAANKKDTIEILITNNRNIYTSKIFIFSYTAPKDYSLEQNFPNPFNPNTKIRYTIPATTKSSPKERTLSEVKLIVYDILGNEVTTLVNEQKEPGYYEVDFNANQLASGVYIYRLTVDDPSIGSGQVFVSVKKMLKLK